MTNHAFGHRRPITVMTVHTPSAPFELLKELERKKTAHERSAWSERADCCACFTFCVMSNGNYQGAKATAIIAFFYVKITSTEENRSSLESSVSVCIHGP